MASIEFIQKRIEGKEKEIAKLAKKLERIQKAQATNWKVNPYYYDEYDLRSCLKDLEEANKALEGYKMQMSTAEEKANSRNVLVIVEFLNAWKERNAKFYEESFVRYLEKRAEYLRKEKEFTEWFNNARHNDPNAEEIMKAFKEMKQEYKANWAFVVYYVERKYNEKVRGYELSFNSEKLKKDLDQEAERKYDFIIERTNAIVGQITDASNLEIGAKHDLNGYIIGTKGIAKVQTIGAGGYNIQCFHFRTLINPMK